MSRTLIAEKVYGCFCCIEGNPERPVWTYFFHTDPRKSAYNPVGKWVFHREAPELGRIVRDNLGALVSEGKIEALKFRPRPNDPNGKFGGLQPPLCVYATETEKQGTYELLMKLGFEDIYWQSEESTRKRV